MKQATFNKFFEAYKINVVDLVSLLLLLLISLFPLWVVYHHQLALSDDTYITLTYAKSLASGKGFVFNHPPATFGTTTPLLTFIIAGFAQFLPGVEISKIAVVFTSLCWVGRCWGVYLGREGLGLSRWQSVIVGCVIVAAGWVRSLGMEAHLFAILLIIGIVLYFHQKWLLTGIIVGLLFLTRGEGILLLPAFISYRFVEVWGRKRQWHSLFDKASKASLKILLGCIIVILLWAIYAWITFGQVLPNTLSVKIAQRAAGYWKSFPNVLLAEWLPTWGQQLTLPCYPKLNLWWVLLIAGLTYTIFEKRQWLILIIWISFYISGYTALDIAAYGWYQLPILFVLQIMVALGLVAVQECVARIESKFKYIGYIFSIILTVTTVVLFVRSKVDVVLHSAGDPRALSYLALADWFNKNTDPSQSIAYVEVGYLGYYTENRIIDLMGLVTPGITPYIAQGDFAQGFWMYEPDYLVYSSGFDWALEEIRANPIFNQTYSPIANLPRLRETDIIIYAHNRVLTHHIRTLWTQDKVKPGKVILFRHNFINRVSEEAVQLDIFADTRYEVWLDGRWIGRGPARFSQVRQEYDSYVLDALDAGQHTIAVLVQYAPNTRRSEDLGGVLFARVSVPATGDLLVGTNADWRVLTSPAWDVRSGYISSWQLIGPREILDLRALPPDWMLPDYDDSDWLTAQVLEPSPLTALMPRTIPMLDNITRLPLEVVEAGTLSPDCHFAALQPHYKLTASATTTLRVESLVTPAMTLDDIPLTWHALNEERRPDVLTATAMLLPGGHTLRVLSPTVESDVLALCSTGVDWGMIAAPVTYRPEQRMLLANPMPGGETAPTVQFTPDGAEIDIPAGDTPRYVVLDFGRTLHARMIVTATGEAGTVIDVGWDERLIENRPLPSSGSLTPFAWGQVDTWVLDETPRVLTTLDARAGRYLLIQVFGSAAVHLSGLHALEETYPVEARGSFTSSDPLLNRIWQVGVDTLIPNMTDAYADPWRERGQWWGDAYVAEHINRVVFGDWQLLRRGIVFMGESFIEGKPVAKAPNADGTYLLDYGMLWVQSLHDYVQFTGDELILDQLYPVLKQFLSYLTQYENPSTGLLDIPSGEWWETALIDWQGETSRSGQSTALNALYYCTLLNAANIADAFSQSSDAVIWRKRAEEIKWQVNFYLYVPDQDRYVASIFNEVELPPTPHAQAWPLACDLVPLENTSAVAKSLEELLPNVGVYGMFWVLEGFGHSRDIPLALEIIKTRYGQMLALGATTWWEGFSSHLNYSASLSHAWGGAPTWFLSTYVLGARQTGHDTWQVVPAFSGVTEVSGQIPLSDGDLIVTWARQNCEERDVWVQAPNGTHGEIIIMGFNDTTILRLNEQVVWPINTSVDLAPNVSLTESGIRVAVDAGECHLNVRQICR